MALEDHVSTLTFNVSGLDDFSRVAKALTQANRQLPRDFKNSINEVARGLRDAARAAVMNEPAKGKDHTGLRARIAKGVGIIQIENGVRIVTAMDQHNERYIPRGMDKSGPNDGWRHPVFGNRSNWTTQTSGEDSWFLSTMQNGEEPLRNRLVRNINDAADKIADAGRG